MTDTTPTEARAATDNDVLTRRWEAVPNDEIGGWAVTTDGRSPLNGGVTAADLMWSQQVAEHVADLHNRTLDGADPDVYADSVRLRALLDNERHQHQAANNQVAALLRELHRTNDQLKVAQRDRDTFQEVARGNKRHASMLAEVLERVEKYADRLANYCSPHGVASRYANELRAELSKPTTVERGVSPAGDVDWAVRVTMHNGASSIRHGDDPLLSRAVAEQIAVAARRHLTVASAEVVCRQVWHGPWTTVPETTGR